MAGDASSIAGNQARTFLSLWASLAPRLTTDRALPERLDQLLKRSRSFGSRDRRLYRELTYTCLRYHGWLEKALEEKNPDAIRALAWLSADIPATRLMKSRECADWPVTPPAIGEKRSVLRVRTQGLSLDSPLLPSWLHGEKPSAPPPATPGASTPPPPPPAVVAGESPPRFCPAAARHLAHPQSAVDPTPDGPA